MVDVITLSGFNVFIWLPTHRVSALFGTRFMEVTGPMYDLHFTRISIKFVVIFWKAGVNFIEFEITTLVTGREKVKVPLLSLLPVGLFIFWNRVKWFYLGTSEIFAVLCSPKLHRHLRVSLCDVLWQTVRT
jgi:hypothetical protein